jgi:hypothetical protein
MMAMTTKSSTSVNARRQLGILIKSILVQQIEYSGKGAGANPGVEMVSMSRFSRPLKHRVRFSERIPQQSLRAAGESKQFAVIRKVAGRRREAQNCPHPGDPLVAPAIEPAPWETQIACARTANAAG